MTNFLNTMAEHWFTWQFAMLWQTAILIAIIWIVDLCIRKWAWPQVRYALWMLILVKLLIPPTLTSPASITSHIPATAFRAATVMERLNTDTQIVPESSRSASAGITGPKGHNTIAADEIPGKSESSQTSPSGATQSSPPAKGEYPEGGRGFLSPKAYAMLIWLAGMAALSLWLIARLTGLRREHLDCNDKFALTERFYTQLEEVAQKLNLRKLPQVVLTDKVACPAVFGIFRPVLLMPAAKFRNMSKQDTEHILLHELAHIKRGDLLVHAVYMILQIAYWFNPLLWMARRPLQNLRELCCDATVAKLLKENTVHYRQTLLDTARQLLAEPVDPGLGLLGLFENSNWLVTRLKWLEKNTWKNRPLRIATIVVLVAIMTTCVLPMANRPKTEAASASDPIENKDFKKTLPNGVTVELLGVCEHPSKGKQWWRPDGSLLEDAPYDDDFGKTFPKNSEKGYKFAIKYSGMAGKEIDSKTELTDVKSTNGGALFSTSKKNNKESVKYIEDLLDEKTIWLGAAFDEVLKNCDVRIGVCSGNWKVKYKYETDLPNDAVEWVTFKNVSLRPKEDKRFKVTGTVTDVQTGKPIAGAEVYDDGYDNNKHRTTTDENGNFTLKTANEEHNISAKADDYQPQQKGLRTWPFANNKNFAFALVPITVVTLDQILKQAEIEARALNHDYIGTEHLLLALVSDGNAVACVILNDLGVDAETVRLEIGKLVKAGSKPVTENKLPLTPRSKKAIAHAKLEAKIRDQDSVTSIHVLLGLLHYYDNVASGILNVLGIHSEDVYLQIKPTQNSPFTAVTAELVQGWVEDFFKRNYRDITARKTLEWGEPVAHEDGNISIRYKYEATIWDKDKIIENKVWTFDKQGKFISVEKTTQNSELKTKNSPFTATLLNGVTVELLGICEHPSEGKQWWRADGTPFNPDFHTDSKGRVSSDGKPYEIAIKVDGPEDLSFTWKQVKGATGSSSFYVQDKEGNDLNNIKASKFVINPKLDSTHIELGVAACKWTTRFTHHGTGTMSSSRSKHGIAFSKAYQIEKDIEITVSDDYFLTDYRLIAVGKNGDIHTTNNRNSNSAAGKVRQSTFTFKNLNRKDIKEFQFQTRPYEWVTFKNISLRPGGKTEVEIEQAGVSRQKIEVDAQQLLMKRRDILQRTLQDVEQKVNAGTADSGELCQAKVDLLRVESELSETQQGRIDALKQIVTLYQKQEKTAELLLAAGRISQDQLDKIKLLLLDAKTEVEAAIDDGRLTNDEKTKAPSGSDTMESQTDISLTQTPVQTLTFKKDMPLVEGLRMLGKMYMVNIIPSQTIIQSRSTVPVTSLYDVNFEDVLKALCGTTHTYEIKDKFIYVYTNEEYEAMPKEITLEQAKKAVAAFFAEKHKQIAEFKPLEWGELTPRDDGTVAIRCKCEIKSYDGEAEIFDAMFFFDKAGKVDDLFQLQEPVKKT